MTQKVLALSILVEAIVRVVQVRSRVDVETLYQDFTRIRGFRRQHLTLILRALAGRGLLSVRDGLVVSTPVVEGRVRESR